MRYVFVIFLVIILASCTQVTRDGARHIAYERLPEMQDGPSMTGNELRQALVVTIQDSGVYLVELRDEERGLMWAVIVQPSGQAEIARMAINGRGNGA